MHRHQGPLKILFIVKSRGFTYGQKTPSGLLKSASMCAAVLGQIPGIETKVVDVVDGNDIDREVHRYGPTHVIIEALWAPVSKLAELLVLYPRVGWVVRAHSKTPFIAGEGHAFTDLAGLRDLADIYRHVAIAANSLTFTDELADVLDTDAVYLPNLYDTRDRFSIAPVRPGELHVGCFGAVRLLKNQLEQAIAAIRFAYQTDRTLYFHINGGAKDTDRVEQLGAQPLKNLRALFTALAPDHHLVEHGWLDYDSFRAVVATMDVGMQVSYTESFNIVAADFVDEGVPIVTSPDIEWSLPALQANPNSSLDMVIKLGRATGLPRARWANEAKLALNAANQHALDTWLAWLGVRQATAAA